jgi:hypothetical protein
VPTVADGCTQNDYVNHGGKVIGFGTKKVCS